jgi:preprotein translocase subunit YajC
MFINEAWAQAAGGSGGAGGAGGLDGLLQGPLPMLVMLGLVFYFFLIRPQGQKQKKHRELLKSMRRGDRVLMSGGMFATVAKIISDTEVQVEIAEGVRVRILKSSVTEVLAKTEPLSKEKKEAKGESAEAESGESSAAEDNETEAANDQPRIAPPAAPQGIAGALAKLFGGK